MNKGFPRDFMWGVATSSYQIEGAVDEDGRGESIWDRFAATPGKIADGSSASVACDHYHRWREDVALMSGLGVNAYRFSVAWPRVIPAGRGEVNRAGLDFYDQLVDGLLEKGITPFVTLYHWDLPQVLQDQGGWAARPTAEAFVAYADAVAARLGDRVKHWVTHNEPWMIAHLGHETGEHAPGHRNPAESLRVAHHILLSHAWAAQAIRSHDANSEVGIVLNLTPAYAVSDSAADKDAARWFDGMFNRWYLDPLYHGRYPEDVLDDRVQRGHIDSAALDFIKEGDLEAIKTPMDFLGVNYYSRALMKAGADGPEGVLDAGRDTLTDMGWEIYAQGLHDLLVRIQQDYAPPKIYITENGCAFADGPNAEGRVDDARRIAYFRDHLAACERAIADGVPLAGYFAWSLLDNFEWAHGFDKRFGLVWVDYETQERIAKDSALWYREFVSANSTDDAQRSL